MAGTVSVVGVIVWAGQTLLTAPLSCMQKEEVRSDLATLREQIAALGNLPPGKKRGILL